MYDFTLLAYYRVAGHGPLWQREAADDFHLGRLFGKSVEYEARN